ncbi:aminopeptidase N [Undibacter mobilis]|uniref:Aminopeptidase N n=1 Tax=Undibacter mobilis TaxID=2292256 RepID=A0A371B3J7_9BRAD|nr:aminopeptidase N [Undibacter mobilis]RDV02120.1 aminopeptidase N [Undibacter mobilis]
MRTDTAPVIRLSDYQAPDWLVDTVHLDVNLHPTATRVRAVLALRPNPTASPAALVLEGDGLALISLKRDGVPLAPDSYVATPDKLTIAQPPHGPFTLEIETLVDPTANTQLSGLYRSSGTWCTQCEAEGFRRITYFPDRPDVMAIYTTRIEADKSEAPVLLANGNLVESGDLDGDRHFAVWHDPHKKPSYLFALVGGDLACVEDTFTTMSSREVTLRIYVEHGKEGRAGYAMDALKRSMRWDEEAFGREYDLDIFMIVAVSDFNMGAMENKGLNVFNDKYVLASGDTATDADFAGIESVIAHEYFHNWTGNRITCRDWFQLCLKEGLTVYRDQEFTSDMRSRPVKRIADVRNLRAAQFVEDSGPLAHPVRPAAYKEINNFYTATVYEKGSEVVRMIGTLIGHDQFRAGMDLYFERHDGEAATVEQFVQCFAEVSGRDMTQFMRWYAQAGTPEVTVKTRYDEEKRTYTISLKQTLAPTPGQPDKEAMLIPLRMGLLDKNGKDLPIINAQDGSIVRDVLILDKPELTVAFDGMAERPVLSINRGFSAPIKLVTDLTGADFALLARHDSDPFNRWQALQTTALRLLIDNVSRLRVGGVPRADDHLIAALAAILDDAGLEPAFIALCLMPPGEGDIAREIGRDIDPDKIQRARQALREDIGIRLGAELSHAYERLTSSEPYSPDAASAGRRALRNVALDLMAATGASPAFTRASEQYAAADNMTDRMAALSTLVQHDAPGRAEALDDFYSRYAENALVIDKWFSLQASSPHKSTLDKVRALTSHPAFSMGNPNRVRALIGAFAHGNLTQFNRADGAGYAFVADAILEIDPKNPQLAARLATAFRTWRTFETGRRTLAEAHLRRIRSHGGLSRDLADIVERALA